MTRSPQLEGLCASDPDLFFPTGSTGPAAVQIEGAKAVCRRCPVMEQCQEWALETREEYGVWGGLDERQRRSILKARARGTVTRPRVPIPAFSTYREAYTLLTIATDGHVEWTGPNEVRIDGKRQSPNQVAWCATREQRPIGRIFPDCDHQGCVEHLADQTVRAQRATKQLAA